MTTAHGGKGPGLSDTAQRRNDLITALLFALALYVAWLLRHTLLLIYISILFAIIFTPAIRWIHRWHIGNWRPGRGAAILILVAGVVGALTLTIVFMVPPIVQDMQGLVQDIPQQLQRLSEHLKNLPFGERIARRLNPAHIGASAEGLLRHATSAVAGIAGGILNLFLVALLTAYFILESNESLNWAMSLIPVNRRSRMRATLSRAAGRAQCWLTGQLLLMLILGALTAIVLGLMRVRYFYALAVFAGFANFVPIIGPGATVVLAGLVALLDSWLKVAGVIGFYLAYQQLENAYLTPRIMEARVGLSGVAVIAALAIGGALAGILGALVAVPTAAMLGTVLDEYVVQQPEERSSP